MVHNSYGGYSLMTPKEIAKTAPESEVDCIKSCRNASSILQIVETILRCGPASARREKSILERAVDLSIGLETCVTDNLTRGQADYLQQIEKLKKDLLCMPLKLGGKNTNRFSPEHVKVFITARTRYLA